MPPKSKAERALDAAREAVAVAQKAVEAERRAKSTKGSEPQRVQVQKGDDFGGAAPVVIRRR